MSSAKNLMRAKMFAVLAVMIILAGAIPMLIPGSIEGYSGDQHTVRYHLYQTKPTVNSDFLGNNYNEDTGDQGVSHVDVNYYGSVVSTEYNPQVWAGTFTDSEGNQYNQNWYPINSYRDNKTLVFTGWVYANGTGYTDSHYPGEVLSEGEMEAATGSDGLIHVYATWGTLANYSNGLTYSFTDGNEYTNIIILGSGTYHLDQLYYDGRWASPGLTIRGGGNTTLYLYDSGSNYSLNQNTIIDSVRISGNFTRNHGDEGAGLYANGHVLIVGTGVNTAPTNITESGYPETAYPQVVGGSNGGTAGLGLERTPLGESSAVSLGTLLILHSGTYGNVVAGSKGGSVSGSTYVVLREVQVLDTLVGACSSSGSVSGSTYVYATSLEMAGDHYEETFLGNDPAVDDIMESTVITGGSNNGQVSGDTHVFISGDSEVWDVQGAGRRGESTVSGTASVEVSGEALVKHVVCGSITDGLGYTGNGSPGHNMKCVDSTEIRIKDSAAAGSVFGGGYDTFYQALYVSMMDGGNISISLEDDCTVGYVYGGGYRGTVGTQSQPIDSVSIEISGGTVLGDVFGGGRGGLDKMTHLSNGDYRWSESEQDTTGFSEIYAEHISISVSEGVVQGNVYGGGESVPIITSYNGEENLDGDHSLGGNDCTQVAAVHCSDISVEITGGTVGGDVYGSGKGVDPDDLDYYDRDGKPVDSSVSGGYSIHSSAYIFAMKKDMSGVYGIAKIPWVSGVGGTVLHNADYSDFALADTGVVTVSIGNAEIGGNVYGGGEIGRLGPETGTGGAVEVTIGSGATVAGDVLAGGYGQTGVLSTNTASKSVVINGSTIGGDVYGGSRFGDDNIDGTTSMAQGDTVIRLVSGSVSGSVYGGGYQGGSNNSVTIYIGGPAVTGDITPAGDKVTIGRSIYGGGYQGSVLGNVSIDIAGIGSVTISDSVYGGGYLGTVGPTSGPTSDTLVMSIGANVTIGGSVYGGGYGESGQLSTNILTRTITINGPTVRGSVYGGSRFGDDNCTSSGGSVLTYGNAILYIVSGDIATGSSGNVYGGGYRGYSAMDTSVYVGVPATEASGADHLSGTLKIRSVYGGSSVGESSNDLSDAELLVGDTMLRIGNLDPATRGSAYADFSITGDVFGEGDYCAITGESSVTFTAFEQEGSMLSVQKADTLDVIGSSLVLDGDVDGSDTQASERLSLNLIGDLRLQRLNGEISSLDMKAAASQIGGYGSLDESGEPIVYSETETDLNTITLRDGMMMSILGEGNNGLSADMNEIRGFTILDNGGDGYYGTFAMGPTDKVQNGYTGFMIDTDEGLVAAQEGHYTFYYDDGTGSTQPVAMTMWFIAGVYKVETTMVLQDDGLGGTISAEDDVMAPKTVSNSTIRFVGGYVNADSQGSLNLVGSPEENPGTEFQVLVGGKADDNHIYFNEGDGIAAFPDSSEQFQGNGIHLNVKVSTLSGFGTTGYAGTVTLHMVEYIGDIPINMFDVEVSIYLRVDPEMGTITETIVMRASGTRKYGTTDVYLPVLGSNHMAEYTIKLLGAENADGSFQDIAGDLTLETVATNLNKNGWQSTENTGKVDSVWNKDMLLGVGGVFAPVIRFSYTADEPFEEIRLQLTIQDENGGDPKVYTIILKPELAEYVELSFYDKYLIYDEKGDSISWSQWEQGADGGYLDPVFVLQLQFGMQLDTIRVAVSNSFIDGMIGNTAIDSMDTVGYINNVRKAISFASSEKEWYGDVLLLQSDTNSDSPVSTVLCGDQSYVNGVLSEQDLQETYTVMGVEKFLDKYVSLKPGTYYKDGSSDKTFVYSDHYSWYDTHECITEFRFSSKISNDLDVFAGYTVTVTVIPFTDEDNPNAADKDYTVTPSTTMIIPGDDVDLDHILSSLTITRGYGAVDSGMWYSMGGDGLSPIGTNSDGRYVITPRVDTTVYLKLERESYSITLVINGVEQTFPKEYGVQVTECVENVVHDSNAAHFGDSVEVTFTYDPAYHIGSIRGTTQLGGFPGLSHSRTDGDTVDTYTVSFVMPSSALTINIELTDKRSVTFEIAGDTGTTDSGRFGLGELMDSDGTISVNVSDSLSTKSRTMTTNTDSADLTVVFGLGIGVLITVDVNGETLYDHLDSSYVTLDLSKAGEEVTVTIQVNVKWSLTTSGEGYGVAINGKEYGSSDLPSYVLTGDVLTVKSTSGSSLTDISYSGVRSNGHDANYVWTFTVNGTGNVSLRVPVFSVVLTINLGFMCGEEQVVLSGGWHPKGTLTVTKVDGTGLMVGEPTVEGGRLVYTMTVESGSYTVSAEFGGFSFVTEPIEVTSGSISRNVTLDAIGYTVHVRPSTSNSFDRTVTWYAVSESGGVWGYSTDTVGSIGSDAEAAAWFRSVNEDMREAEVAGEDETVNVGMFGDGAALYLLAVPGLDGEEGEVVDPPEFHAVVIVVDGEVNGTHTIATIPGVDDGTYTADMGDGTEVTVAYDDNKDRTATLTVTGCPVGLGGLALMCSDGVAAFNLLIYSVPDLGAIA